MPAGAVSIFADDDDEVIRSKRYAICRTGAGRPGSVCGARAPVVARIDFRASLSPPLPPPTSRRSQPPHEPIAAVHSRRRRRKYGATEKARARVYGTYGPPPSPITSVDTFAAVAAAAVCRNLTKSARSP